MTTRIHPALAEHRLEMENEKLRELLRDTTAVAITMLYEGHRADVLAEFTVPELEAVVLFLGIGSEAFCAAEMGRKAIGVELKKSYFEQAVKNIDSLAAQADMFAIA